MGFCRQHSSEAKESKEKKLADDMKVRVKASRRKRLGVELKAQCYRAVRVMNDDVAAVAGLGSLVEKVREWEAEGE
ncbi:MAG: hypothetical protein DRH30_05455 [Deltaproteobacteria bacterium]|nr:MAG: hypothetical protein DRH30_05455 [Deltaproteobacteria bacterium]